MIAKNFIKGKDKGNEVVYDKMEFIVKILGYLIQDVYKMRKDMSNILSKTFFGASDEMFKPTLLSLMKKCVEHGLDDENKNLLDFIPSICLFRILGF